MTNEKHLPLPFFTLEEGRGPLIAAAVHHGHATRPEVRQLLKLSNDERRREEDPFTGSWTEIADTRVIGRRSRFEVDLNRPRDKAVYLAPEDAWGLDVWQETPPKGLIERSLDQYDTFYERMYAVLSQMIERHGAFVVFDLHSYNHRRGGPEAEYDDPEANPEINVGTGSLDRGYWGPLVDQFINDARSFDYNGRSLDVRENIRFTGGHFPGWINEQFPKRGCALAIEAKKIFMDEWTGEGDPANIEQIKMMLKACIPGALEALETCVSESVLNA